MADPIDYTNAFGDVQRGFLAAQSVVKSTRAGKDGLIRVIIDENQQVKFFSPIANRSFSTFSEALDVARSGSGRYVTSLDIFSADEPRPGSLSIPSLGKRKIPAPFAEDRSGAGRQIFKDMVNRINNLTANEKKILIDAGINVDDFVKHGQMFQATFTLDDETIFGSASAARKVKYKDKKSRYEDVLSYVNKLFGSEDTGLKSDAHMLGQGIQVLDSDSSLKVIGFRLADPASKKVVNFNSYQANLLVSVLGNNFLNPEVFDKIFSASDPSQIVAGSSSRFSGKALKISKRLKAAFGDRPISLAGDDLNSAISQALAMEAGKSPKVGKVKKINHSLSDHVLVTDFEFDVMRNWAFDDKMDNVKSSSGKFLRGKEERALYKNLKSGNYVDSVIGFFTGDPTRVSKNIASRRPVTTDMVTEKELDVLKSAVRDVVTSDRGGKGHITAYDKKSGKFGSEILMDELSDALRGKGLNDTEIKKLKNVAKAMMKQAELAKDGADVINAKFLRAQVASLDSNIQEIESILKDPSLNLDSSEKALLKDKLENIKRSRRSFQSAIDHGGQVTGRISVGGMSTAKDIVSVSELVDDLKDIFFVLNKTSFKKETAMAGRRGNITEFINLSGMVSDYADNVKIDYAAAAAHGSIFATKEHFDAAEQRAKILMNELDDALDNNHFSPRIRAILDRVSSSDASEMYEDMSDFARIAATKAKEQARVINEYIQRGGNVSENVEIANALFDIVGREIYRYDSSKDEAKIVMANVYRFGLDSEAGLLGRTLKKKTNKGEVYQASEIFLGGKNGVVDRQIVSDIMVGGESFELSEEIIKFRIADHKVLLSEDAVARYMHALGGFDLDDKGLPIITRFQTSSGVEKMAFNLLRQPTGPEESMFLLPNFDAETVRSLLSRDEMRYALENLQGEFSDFSQASGIFDRMTQEIQSRGINRFDFDLTDPLAGYKVREEFGRSMRLLTSIMEGDGSIGGLYNYENQSKLAQNVEQAMLDLLRYAELREFTTVSDVTRRQARKISRFGTSSLMSPPGVDEVGYTSQGIFKLLDEEGVFDPTESMTQALRQAGYDDDFINRFKNYTDPSIKEGMEGYSPFDLRMKFLSENIDDQNKLSALFSTALGFHGAKRIQTKGGGELGTYINSSMVVSSMLDQYQDFLFDVNKTHRKKMKTVYNKLLEYNIGLISQETAIDIAVNQGGLRSLDREKVRISTLAQLSEGEYGSFLDTKKLTGVINTLHGSADLETLNEAITPGIIKQTAFIRALSDTMGMGYDGGYGFDFDLFQSRMLKDPKKMVDYMGIYANEAEEAFKFAEGLGFQVSASQKELIDKMKSLYLQYQNADRQDQAAKLDEINKFMEHESGMFLSGTRKEEYANVSRFNELSGRLQGKMAKKRQDRYGANMARQKAKIDSALSYVTRESKDRAQDIVERYSDDLLKFKQVRIADLLESEVESDVLRRFEVMDNLYKEIADNSRLENVSRFDILTALDSVLLDQKIDIAAGKMLPQIEGANAMSEMIRSISSARSLRDIRQAINNDVAGIGGELFQKFSSLTESYGGETFAERLQSYVDANTKRGIVIGLNDMEERMIRRFLSGNADTEEVSQLRRLSKDALSDAGQAASEFLAQDSAIYGSFAARAQYLDNQAEFEELIKYGTAESEAELAQEMGEDFEEFRARDVEVKKTQYKRISDKIREAEFIDFIKKPAVKKTLYGMAALIGASFGYQAYKDRTHSDMQGPPLLPGGSAYEVRPGQGSYNLENVYNQGYSPGVSYQVSLHGDQNSINNFRQSVGDLNYGNLTTTMYSNLPRLNRDLYADVAPDF